MIQESIDDIITALGDISEAAGGVDQFAGDIEELKSKPKRLPALWVLYDGASFEDRKMEEILAEHTMNFTIVLIAKNHRSRADGAEACHLIIEAVRDRLIGRIVENVGELWPVRERLIMASGPLLVYGLNYRIEAEYTSS